MEHSEKEVIKNISLMRWVILTVFLKEMKDLWMKFFLCIIRILKMADYQQTWSITTLNQFQVLHIVALPRQIDNKALEFDGLIEMWQCNKTISSKVSWYHWLIVLGRHIKRVPDRICNLTTIEPEMPWSSGQSGCLLRRRPGFDPGNVQMVFLSGIRW